MVGNESDLLNSIRQMGFTTIVDFLGRYPGESYFTVVKRLGPAVAPMQLTILQMEEAKAEGRMRDAAMDALARELNTHFVDGWGVGEKADYKAASAFADWRAMLVVEGKSAELKETATLIWQCLKKQQPPTGWKPSGPLDPLIQRAFAEGWPMTPPIHTAMGIFKI